MNRCLRSSGGSAKHEWGSAKLCAMNPWIDVILKVMTAAAATGVAIYVAQISRRQWLTNKEKLRLDLYDRRFDIYMRVLDMYQAVISWEGTSEQKKLQYPFIKAHLEARFLFPADSGINEYLNEFRNHSFKIVNFDQLTPLAQAAPEKYLKFAKEREASAGWLLNSIEELERKLAPFLNFHDM